MSTSFTNSSFFANRVLLGEREEKEEDGRGEYRYSVCSKSISFKNWYIFTDSVLLREGRSEREGKSKY